MELTNLPAIKREYTLLRDRDDDPRGAAPALWLRGSRPTRRRRRSPMSRSTKPQTDKAAMFRNAAYVFKDGESRRARRQGLALHQGKDAARAARLRSPDQQPPRHAITTDLYGLPRSLFEVQDAALPGDRRLSRRSHAAADPQGNSHRRELRRGLSDDRLGRRRHRRRPANGPCRPRNTMTGYATSVIGCDCEAGIDCELVAGARRRTDVRACACCCSASRPRASRRRSSIASANAC